MERLGEVSVKRVDQMEYNLLVSSKGRPRKVVGENHSEKFVDRHFIFELYI